MRHSKLISVLMAVALVFAFAASAWAVNITKAGTTITNTATVNFQNAAGTAMTPQSSTVTTTVQLVLSWDIAPTAVTSINVIPGQLNVANQFLINNNGNEAMKFEITPLTNASVSTIRYYVNTLANATNTVFDGVGVATLLSASDTAPANVLTPVIDYSAVTPAFATAGAYPSGTIVFVVVDIPAAWQTAATITKTQTAGSVHPQPHPASTNATAVNMNDVLQVGALTILKEVRNAGPLGTASSAWGTTATGIPTDILEYRVTITSTGTGSATAIQVSDPIDANTIFGGAITAATGTSVVAATSTVNNLVVNVGQGATAAAPTSTTCWLDALGGLNTVVKFTYQVTIK